MLERPPAWVPEFQSGPKALLAWLAALQPMPKRLPAWPVAPQSMPKRPPAWICSSRLPPTPSNPCQSKLWHGFLPPDPCRSRLRHGSCIRVSSKPVPKLPLVRVALASHLHTPPARPFVVPGRSLYGCQTRSRPRCMDFHATRARMSEKPYNEAATDVRAIQQAPGCNEGAAVAGCNEAAEWPQRPHPAGPAPPHAKAPRAALAARGARPGGMPGCSYTSACLHCGVHWAR